MSDYEYHELANIFPLLEGSEFEELVDDIRENGLRQPVTLYEGKILDGRNRYRACKEAGVEPVCHTYTGDDAAGYVVSLNIMRRHLSESQRAIAAAKLAGLPDGVRADRQGVPIGAPSPSRAMAAEMFGVGERSVARGQAVVRRGVPELVDAVERGNMAVARAAEITKLAPEEQREAVRHHHRTSNSGDEEWYTPDDILESVRAVLGCIDLDPASSESAQARVCAANYYTAEDDGLSRDWSGRVWMNPPYTRGSVDAFMAKLSAEYQSGRVPAAVAVTNAYTDTEWFHGAASVASAICFKRRRIRFISDSWESLSPAVGSVFFYYGPDVPRFAEVFGEMGLVVRTKI